MKKFTSTVALILILSFVISAFSIVLVSAANPEYSELTSPEKVLTVLEEVVGLDIARYSTDLEFYAQAPFLYFEVLPQEDVKYMLESNESKLEVICAFVDEKLRSLHVYLIDGSPLTTKPVTSPLEMAKDFLEKYPAYSDASYYSIMRSMLDNVEGDKSITKTVENIKLEVTVTATYTSFRWKYVFNGVEAPSKCVALKFENEFMKYFIDKWSLCTIGSTDLNISEEGAIEIAMNAAENYSWNVGGGGDNPPVTVTEFNVVGVSETKLSFGNYPTKNESRDGDPLTLYPGWRVKLYFDKLYPGYVYGLDIALWADTGEVNDIRALISGFPNNDPEFPSWTPIYIRSDGSVEGTDKIQRDGNVYTLTGDISGGIKVERNFTVIDGAGYTLQGNGDGCGVDVRWHGTVQNLQIIGFDYGISAVSDNTILGNYIADCGAGIWILGGTNNLIKNNTFVNNTNPISIAYSSGGGHVITENSFIDGTFIINWMSPEPTVDRNYWSNYNGIDNDGDGIGDTPHIRIVGDETIYIDYHPLMEPVPVIPEFPSWTPLWILLVTVMAVAVVYKRKIQKQGRLKQ